jgi:O-antigen ligase
MGLTGRLRAVLLGARRDGRSGGGETAAFMLLLLFGAAGPLLYGPAPTELRPAIGGGDVAPPGNTWLCLFAFLLVSLTFLSSSAPVSARRRFVAFGALLAIALLGALQLVPLPVRILEAVAPVNLKIYHETAEVLSLYGRVPPLPRISLAPRETENILLLLLAFGSLFEAALRLLQTRFRRRLFVGALFVSGVTQIVLGASSKASPGRIRGTFANPNHLAGYLEILLALAFAALWTEAMTNRERAADAVTKSESFEKRFPPLASRVLLWSVMAAGIVLTQSRGGILAAALTTFVLFAAAIGKRGSRARRRAARTAAAALLAGILLAVASSGLARFSRFLQTDPRELASTTRATLWELSWRAWRDFPIVGSGLGTFREAFVRVAPRDLPGLVEQAHNDFLQLAVTGGAVGAGAGVVLFGSLFLSIGRAFSRQRHREESAYALAGFGALFSLVLHGLVEFNLSIPIIPATLACVLGCAWAAGSRS